MADKVDSPVDDSTQSESEIEDITQSEESEELDRAAIFAVEFLMSRGDQASIDRLPTLLPAVFKIVEENCALDDPSEIFCDAMKILKKVVDIEPNRGLIEEYANVLLSISAKVLTLIHSALIHGGLCVKPDIFECAASIIRKLCKKFASRLNVSLIEANLHTIVPVMIECFREVDNNGHRSYEGYNEVVTNLKWILKSLTTSGAIKMFDGCCALLKIETWQARSLALLVVSIVSWSQWGCPFIAQLATNNLLNENPMVRYSARQLFDAIMAPLKRNSIDERVVESMVGLVMKNLVKELIERGEEGRIEEGIFSSLREIASNCQDSPYLIETAESYDPIMRALRSFLTGNLMQNEHSSQSIRDFVASSISLIGFKFKDKWRNDFPEIFTILASFNQTVDRNIIEVIENCFSCDEKKAEVVLRKKCESDEVKEKSGCGECFCRPYWCLPCLSRIFYAKNTNLMGKCPCPFCHKSFCLLDVLRIGDALESTNEE